jgi:uncharacterized membrane protein
MQFARAKTGGMSFGDLERWSLVAGGSALIAYGLSRRSTAGFLISLLGGDIIYQGLRAHRHSHESMGARSSTGGIRLSEVITVNKRPEELYRFWRNMENLPSFMRHLDSVKILDGKRSHWVARGPLGTKVEWDAEIVRDIENQLITWQSLENADVINAGSVSFRPALGNRGTEVKVVLRYEPPGGSVGWAFAKIFRQEPSQHWR